MMVARIPPRDEAQAQEEFTALQFDSSTLIADVPVLQGMSLFTCGLRNKPTATGYWIGNRETYLGFLVVEFLSLPGLIGLHATRGWVEGKYRGQGLSTILRKAALTEYPLISDRDGITDQAHAAWINTRFFARRYYDQHEWKLVDEAQVPVEQRFTDHASGRRWLMVLWQKHPFTDIDTAPTGYGVYEIYTHLGVPLKVGIASNLRKRLNSHRASRDSGLRLKPSGDRANPDHLKSHSSILAKHLYYDSAIAPDCDLTSQAGRRAFLQETCYLLWQRAPNDRWARDYEVLREDQGGFRYTSRVRKR